MPAFQQIYQTIGKGIAGAIAATGAERDCGILDADVAPGLGVCDASGSDYGMKLVKSPESEAEALRFCGVVIYNSSMLLNDDGAYDENENVPLLTSGTIWVVVEDAVTRGERAYMRHTANGANETLGAFRSDADNDGDDDTAVALPNCRFASSTDGAGIAMLEVNLPS